MAIDDPYVELDIIKARLNVTGTDKDDALTVSIAAATKAIDDYCGQTFNRSATATERLFTVPYADVLEVPNLVSVTALAADDGSRTYPTSWAASDYDLFPYDAAEKGEPYTEIHRSPLGRYSWPATVKGVRISAIWGWPSVPAPIVEACALLASRLWRRTKTPLGLSEDTDLQTEIPRVDPDVRALLQSYRAVIVL